MSELRQLAMKHVERQLREGGVDFDSARKEHGTDLIARIGSNGHSEARKECKIRISVNSQDRVNLYQEWKENIDLIVYVWNLTTTTADIYALSYAEAFALLNERGHTKTESWKVGGYSLKVGNCETRTWWSNRLSPYLMDGKKFRARIASVCSPRN
jgi:hypothetical protein